MSETTEAEKLEAEAENHLEEAGKAAEEALDNLQAGVSPADPLEDMKRELEEVKALAQRASDEGGRASQTILDEVARLKAEMEELKNLNSSQTQSQPEVITEQAAEIAAVPEESAAESPAQKRKGRLFRKKK